MAQPTPNVLLQSYKQDLPPNCILQVLEIKRIQPRDSTSERFRLVLNDGKHYQQAMLTTQLNHLVNVQGPQQLQDFCLIQIQEAIASEVSKKNIIVILRCEVVGRLNGPFGSPQNVEQDAGNPMMQAQPINQPLPPVNPYNQPPAYMQQKPLGGPVAAINSGPMTYHPINSLNPYQTRWTIKARVTSKSDMRTWTNQKGEGKLFSVDLLDAQGGQIRATMFNDAADKYFDMFQVDRVYTISKGVLKVANKKFSHVPNDYELTLNADAEIQLAGDDGQIEQQRFDFIPFEAVRSKHENDVCDVIGVVTHVHPLSSVIAKQTQREIKKRSITIADTSMLTIELTLWGEQAEKYNETVLDQNPVIAVKRVKVSEFNGKQLSASFGSDIFINPDRPESRQLIQWWQSQGYSAQLTSLTERSAGAGSGGGVGGSIDDPRQPLKVIVERKLGFGEKPDYLTVRGTIARFAQGEDFSKVPWYLACPTCNKKVGQSNWCEKCNTTVPEPNPRYLLSLILADSTHFVWVTAFSEQGQMILGKPAVDLLRMQEIGDTESYQSVFAAARFTDWIFKLKIKAEQSQQDQEQKARCSIIGAQPVDYVKESRSMLEEIQRYPSAPAHNGNQYGHQAYQSNNYY